MMQGTGTGIGRALQRAREHRGKSLEEVSRETRVRTDYLQALEREAFDDLGGDVYVRGFLRSYSKYLGLNHEKVVSTYERAYGRSKPDPAPVERAPTVATTEALALTERKRPNWFLAGSAAVIVLAAAGAIGLIGGSSSVPEPADLTPPPSIAVTQPTVEVGIEAHQTLDFTVSVDGEETSFRLDEGESRSFEGQEQISVSASEGAVFGLIVNGKPLDSVGERRSSYQDTFTPDSFREGASATPAP